MTRSCEHKSSKYNCRICWTQYFCIHDSRKRECTICNPELRCEHGNVIRNCKICNPDRFCTHGQRKEDCKPCNGIDPLKFDVYLLMCGCGLCYVGSTYEFHRRQLVHKRECYNTVSQQYNKKLYQHIRSCCTFDDVNIMVLESGIGDKRARELAEYRWQCYFDSVENGLNGLYSYTIPRVYTCEKCGYKTENKSNYTRHIKRKTPCN